MIEQLDNLDGGELKRSIDIFQNYLLSVNGNCSPLAGLNQTIVVIYNDKSQDSVLIPEVNMQESIIIPDY
jgi:hypothetical protein